MKVVYVTIVSKEYLALAVCAYRSLLRHTQDTGFVFFCMDEESLSVTRRLAHDRAHVLNFQDFLTPDIVSAKERMLYVEYCVTLKPIAIEAAFDADPEAEWVACIDSDMLFMSDPVSVFSDAPNANGILTEHRFSPAMMKWAPIAGTHNGGFLAFRRTEAARDALRWWLAEALARPHHRERKGETFDQKIFDVLPSRHPGFLNCPAKGLNAGPWNIDNYEVTWQDGRVFVDDDPLLIYHFQGMRMYGTRLVDIYCGEARQRKDVVRHIYRPYLKHLRAAFGEVRTVVPEFNGDIVPFFSDYRLMINYLQKYFSGQSNLIFS